VAKLYANVNNIISRCLFADDCAQQMLLRLQVVTCGKATPALMPAAQTELPSTQTCYLCTAAAGAGRRALAERTTRTGRPFWQDVSSALFILSNVWSNDCTLLTRLLPDRSRPPLPVYRNHSPSSRSSSYLRAPAGGALWAADRSAPAGGALCS